MILIFRRQQFGYRKRPPTTSVSAIRSVPRFPANVSLVLPLRLHEQEILLKGLSYCDVFQGDNM